MSSIRPAVLSSINIYPSTTLSLYIWRSGGKLNPPRVARYNGDRIRKGADVGRVTLPAKWRDITQRTFGSPGEIGGGSTNTTRTCIQRHTHTQSTCITVTPLENLNPSPNYWGMYKGQHKFSMNVYYVYDIHNSNSCPFEWPVRAYYSYNIEHHAYIACVFITMLYNMRIMMCCSCSICVYCTVS